MKIVVEGPSAVGKSTLCQKLRDKYKSTVVDELIIEPIQSLSPFEEATYYLNKEISRWNTCIKSAEKLILDTDPLKSMWFNWSLDYVNCLSLPELQDFFIERVKQGDIGFADLYIVMNASREELTTRKNTDIFRVRDNFEWISNANTYREKYYEYLHKIIPDHVVFIDQADPYITFIKACKAVDSAVPLEKPFNDIFINIIDWIKKDL